MPSARTSLPALTEPDVAALRDQLQRGVTPRVRLLAGGTGAVVSIGNPENDGPEYIKVKVTLNGTRDTLPFAPEDLASTSRRPVAATAIDSKPAPIAKTKRRPARKAPLRAAPNVVITVRTAGPEWLVDAARDGNPITEGVVLAADVVQAVADQVQNSALSAAVAEVASVRRSEAAGRVERLRAELTAAEADLASYQSGR